jgi:hypothetical protein
VGWLKLAFRFGSEEGRFCKPAKSMPSIDESMPSVDDDLQAMWSLLDRDEPDQSEMRESFSALRDAEARFGRASDRPLFHRFSNLFVPAVTVRNGLSHSQGFAMLHPVFKVCATACVHSSLRGDYVYVTSVAVRA